MTEIDSWTETINGVKFQVRLVPDYDASTADADCYSEEDLRTYRNGSWSFVGVIVTADIIGIDPEWTQASLWGVQYGELRKIERRLIAALAARKTALTAYDRSKTS
jgi:hypothetical protein